jgi:hypothetical protein
MTRKENGHHMCSDTSLSQANMLSGYQKPLVMTLVTRSICYQISKSPDRKKSKNAPEQPMVSISSKQKQKQAYAFVSALLGIPVPIWFASRRQNPYKE